ncbi:sulfotransferase [Tistrella bauzanensis]|uniref:Sulfotransferase n=1 Tax=Tistrella bauzanensis TaxID=657419 RepID=A0ABQ1IWJ0_9PROT|nr:sulfotransferase domain-containing protein [Tistrella bauzanensis]GGB52798.1 sulfotransferase [Tistrella bauzanensis]
MGAIIWLASYPKSGNTWTRAFLHNLLRDAKSPVPPDRFAEFCLGESKPHWYLRYLDKPLTEATEAEIMKIRPLVQRDMTLAFPDSVFAKTHNMVAERHGVPLISMAHSAGGIYIVRNPLDVVSSVADHFGLDIDGASAMMANEGAITATDERNVFEVLGSWSQHVKSWTQVPNPGLHVMRYEDMTDRPQQTFRKLTDFLGLKPPRERLERAIRFSSFKMLKQMEERHGFRERSVNSKAFFRSGGAGKWRERLTPDQIRRIIADHHQQMARFGYIPADYADALPDPEAGTMAGDGERTQ